MILNSDLITGVKKSSILLEPQQEEAEEKGNKKMESDLQQHHHFLHDHQLLHQQKQLNSGLTRYQSAPSAYFSSFLDTEFCEDFLNRPASPETERIFSRFLSNANGGSNNNNNNQLDQNPKMMESAEPKTQTMQVMNNQVGIMQQRQKSYYQNQAQQNLQQNQSSGSEMDYRVMSSVGLDQFPRQMKMSSNNSNLTRHSSSPAGLFKNIKIENGFVVMKGMGDYGAGAGGGTGNNINTNREASFASSGRPPVGSNPMSPIAEIRNQTNNAGGFSTEGHGNNFPIDSWDDSLIMSENISGVKRLREDDRTLSGLSAAETQNLEPGTRPPPLLSHHLSLPKDMTSIEKLLQYQDSVPCKIRAKRGCATHPRSIAERVRRTKISERMRKLQELVPNMDKQTNTADMLDLAVDYVKELQRQVKELSDNRAQCTCSNHHHQQP